MKEKKKKKKKRNEIKKERNEGRRKEIYEEWIKTNWKEFLTGNERKNEKKKS